MIDGGRGHAVRPGPPVSRHCCSRHCAGVNGEQRADGILTSSEHGPDLDATRVRELAGIRLAIEVATAAAIGGDAKARQDIVRLSNLAARKERELRAAKRAAPAAPPSSLHERLAARYAPAIKGGAT
jgi:hypothetical protein